MLTRAVARSGMSLGNAVALLAGHRTVVSDTFTRADNASSLGTAETGQTWVVLSSTWGISGNQAYNPGSIANAVAVCDAGLADVTVQVTFSTTATDTGLTMRATDASNYLRVIPEAGTWYLQKVVAGAISTIVSVAGANNNGDVLKVTMLGSALAVFLNGAQILSGSDAFNATATKHGLQANTNGGRFDNFKVTVP